MRSVVELFVTEGALQGERFTFAERDTCLIGRGRDCAIRLPDDEHHKSVSRYHCLLDINPPAIRIRDFGSLNGTWINGRRIGRRREGQSVQEAVKDTFPEYDLAHGDVIRLGRTAFRVSIDPAGPVPEHLAVADPGGLVAWSNPADADQVTLVLTEPTTTTSRSQSMTGTNLTIPPTGMDPDQYVKRLFNQAKAGTLELVDIQGYDIVRTLGQGGMGAVYLAHHRDSGQELALKVMLPKTAADVLAREMFQREMANCLALDHPNVVRTFDAGSADNAFFMTMEFCDGGSIDGLYNKNQPLPIDQAMSIVLQALDGLAYTHHAAIPNVRHKDGTIGTGCGLVHRDIKPKNIFLKTENGERVTKIADFGIAKSFDNAGLSGQTCTGTAGGAPHYMSRQQVVNFKYAKPAVDVWAMAATLYHMLTGQPPRDFKPGQDPWRTVLTTSAVPIRKRNSNIPAKLAEVIDAALVDSPQIQVTSAIQFRQALVEAW